MGAIGAVLIMFALTGLVIKLIGDKDKLG